MYSSTGSTSLLNDAVLLGTNDVSVASVAREVLSVRAIQEIEALRKQVAEHVLQRREETAERTALRGQVSQLKCAVEVLRSAMATSRATLSTNVSGMGTLSQAAHQSPPRHHHHHHIVEDAPSQHVHAGLEGEGVVPAVFAALTTTTAQGALRSSLQRSFSSPELTLLAASAERMALLSGADGNSGAANGVVVVAQQPDAARSKHASAEYLAYQVEMLASALTSLSAKVAVSDARHAAELATVEARNEQLVAENAVLRDRLQNEHRRIADGVLVSRQIAVLESNIRRMGSIRRNMTRARETIEAVERNAMACHDDMLYVAQTNALRGPLGEVVLVIHDFTGFSLVRSCCPDLEQYVLHLYTRCLRGAAVFHGGYESAIVGDFAMHVFSSASDAASFALHVQREMSVQPWPDILLSHSDFSVVCSPGAGGGAVMAAAGGGASLPNPSGHHQHHHHSAGAGNHHSSSHHSQPQSATATAIGAVSSAIDSSTVLFRGVRLRSALALCNPTCYSNYSTGRMQYAGREVATAAKLCAAAFPGEVRCNGRFYSRLLLELQTVGKTIKSFGVNAEEVVSGAPVTGGGGATPLATGVAVAADALDATASPPGASGSTVTAGASSGSGTVYSLVPSVVAQRRQFWVGGKNQFMSRGLLAERERKRANLSSWVVFTPPQIKRHYSSATPVEVCVVNMAVHGGNAFNGTNTSDTQKTSLQQPAGAATNHQQQQKQGAGGDASGFDAMCANSSSGRSGGAASKPGSTHQEHVQPLQPLGAALWGTPLADAALSGVADLSTSNANSLSLRAMGRGGGRSAGGRQLFGAAAGSASTTSATGVTARGSVATRTSSGSQAGGALPHDTAVSSLVSADPGTLTAVAALVAAQRSITTFYTLHKMSSTALQSGERQLMALHDNHLSFVQRCPPLSGSITAVVVDKGVWTPLFDSPQHTHESEQVLRAFSSTVVAVASRHSAYESNRQGDTTVFLLPDLFAAIGFASAVHVALLDAPWPAHLEADFPHDCGTVLDVDPGDAKRRRVLFAGLRARIGVNTGNPARFADPASGRLEIRGPFLHRLLQLIQFCRGGETLVGEQGATLLGAVVAAQPSATAGGTAATQHQQPQPSIQNVGASPPPSHVSLMPSPPSQQGAMGSGPGAASFGSPSNAAPTAAASGSALAQLLRQTKDYHIAGRGKKVLAGFLKSEDTVTVLPHSLAGRQKYWARHAKASFLAPTSGGGGGGPAASSPQLLAGSPGAIITPQSQFGARLGVGVSGTGGATSGSSAVAAALAPVGQIAAKDAAAATTTNAATVVAGAGGALVVVTRTPTHASTTRAVETPQSLSAALTRLLWATRRDVGTSLTAMQARYLRSWPAVARSATLWRQRARSLELQTMASHDTSGLIGEVPVIFPPSVAGFAATASSALVPLSGGASAPVSGTLALLGNVSGWGGAPAPAPATAAAASAFPFQVASPSSGGAAAMGTVVFLDLEGSAKLHQDLGDVFTRCQLHCNALVQDHLRMHGGHRVKHNGWDAFMLIFAHVTEALQCCLDLQVALVGTDWPPELSRHEKTLRVRDARTGVLLFCGPRMRMVIHTGLFVPVFDAASGRTDYVGSSCATAGRLCKIPSGGEILCTPEATEALHRCEMEFRCIGGTRYIEENATGDDDGSARLPGTRLFASAKFIPRKDGLGFGVYAPTLVMRASKFVEKRLPKDEGRNAPWYKAPSALGAAVSAARLPKRKIAPFAAAGAASVLVAAAAVTTAGVADPKGYGRSTSPAGERPTPAPPKHQKPLQSRSPPRQGSVKGRKL